MKNLIKLIGIFTCIACGIMSHAESSTSNVPQKPKIIIPSQQLGATGYISFTITPDKLFSNGPGRDKKLVINLLNLPGIGRSRFYQTKYECRIFWSWSKKIKTPPVRYSFPRLLPDKTYFIQYTWNADKGIFNGYINGIPQRREGTIVTPWEMPTSTKVIVYQNAMHVSQVKTSAKYFSPQQIKQKIPQEYYKKNLAIFTTLDGKNKKIDYTARTGRLLYQNKFNDATQLKDWVMEGPGVIKVKNDWLEMSSTGRKGKLHGHFVYWCKKDFPDSFIAEWEFQTINSDGLCIVFFAAQGTKGEDIFDPELAPRNGNFTYYIKGDIISYHISYYANTPGLPGRGTLNLRKNNNFYLAANGRLVTPGPETHKLVLIKDRNHIQFLIDGKISLDYYDDGKRYGKVYSSGKIGLRQMVWMQARYKNFKVHELKK
jgi:Domain of unknown function (DUF1961)